jgi:hypothetical protein
MILSTITEVAVDVSDDFLDILNCIVEGIDLDLTLSIDCLQEGI